MLKKTIFSLSLLSLASAGCATTQRGVVAMKVSATEAHVGMGTSDVSVGDHVELYKNVCVTAAQEGPTPRNGFRQNCHKEQKGHGIVTSVINADYSVVKFDSGTEFKEGDTVEKHPH